MLSSNKCTTYELGKICAFQNGFAFKSSMFYDEGTPLLRIANIVNNRIDSSDVVYINPNDYREDLSSYKVQRNDIVIAMSGATTGKIGINLSENTFFLNQRVGKFIPNENYLVKKYLYYILLDKRSDLYNLAGGGAQPNLSNRDIKKMKIEVPDVSEQNRIVSILDRFDTLTTDITDGLPAEIAARQQQYEYYRDKLLTFKEK